MANTKSHSLGPGLSAAEQTAGFCYLLFYAFVLPWLLRYLSDLLGLGLSDLQINLCYFVLNCIVVWIIFHRFLLRSFRCIRFWELVQALILGFVLYYVGNHLFRLLTDWLGISVTSYNNNAVFSLLAQSRWALILCAVILGPLVEETLVRGLLFGVLRRKSRILAYVASILFFSLLHVWQYLLSQPFLDIVMAALQYVPAGIALGWTYEKSDTIWAPIALHMVINAITFGLMTV